MKQRMDTFAELFSVLYKQTKQKTTKNTHMVLKTALKYF